MINFRFTIKKKKSMFLAKKFSQIISKHWAFLRTGKDGLKEGPKGQPPPPPPVFCRHINDKTKIA